MMEPLWEQPLLNFARHPELLLILAQGSLGAFAFGNVAHESDEAALAVQFHVAEADFNWNFRAVLAPAHGFSRAPIQFLDCRSANIG